MSCHKPSEHHILPKSRGGRRTCIIPENFHEAWHIIFEDLTPKEIEEFVKRIQQFMWTSNYLTWEDINTIKNSIKKKGVKK